MNYGEGLSASDVALLSGNGNNSGWGEGNGAWWIVIFLIFAFMGFGNRGFGNNGANGGVVDGYALATDFATIERKLDTVNSGICDATYALNNAMTNGFANVQSTLCQGFSGVNQNIVANGYETRLGINGIGAELANCCCQIKEGIAGINYNMAMNTNNLQNTMCMNVKDIVENMNLNYRKLHDEIVANRMEDKNIQIQNQQNEINALRLKASQEAQNAYLLNELKPCPRPSFVVQAPTPVNFPTNCCGQVNYCGC